MINDMTSEDVRKLLNLEPNATCGFVRETYRATQAIAPGGLPAPFADGRPLGSALYFMVTPQAPVRLHRIRNDQLYHYYLGDPIEVLLLRGDGRARHRRTRSAGRPPCPAADSGEYLSHRAPGRQQALVPRRQHRMAGRRSPPTSNSASPMS